MFLVVLALVGCRGEDELHVFAASSLTDAFAELETTYEAAHPGTDVRVNSAGSQTLRLQIEHGAPADVFASANPEHMSALVSQSLVGTPTVFATNRLVIAVPRSNPAGIATAADLPRARRVVVGAAAVPAGKYADTFLSSAGDLFGSSYETDVRAHLVSREPNVRLALAKVTLGEADAAIVYGTDLRHRTDVVAVEIPAQLQPAIAYTIAVVGGAPRGQRWVSHLQSDTGRRTLARHGFGAPP
jgi:molybdate transport system substrate-binding protein